MDEQILPYDILRFDYKERLTDRFLTTHLHRFEMFTKPVALVVLVEIINPWHPASVLGQKIINTLAREFSRSESSSHLTRFETALNQANRALLDTLDQTKSPVSCVAVLLEADQIHAAGSGTAKLGLRRNGKLATIIGAKNTASDNFAAVTSGDLKKDDWLIIANDFFFTKLAELDGEIWNAADVASFGENVSQSGKASEPRPSAGVLLRFSPDSPTTNQTFFGDETVFEKTGFSHPVASKINPAAIAKIINRLAKFIGSTQQRGKSILRHLIERKNVTWKIRRPWPSSKLILVALLILVVGAGVWFGWQRFGQNPTVEEPKSTLFSELRNTPKSQLLNELNDKFTLENYQSLSGDDKSALGSLLADQKIKLVELPSATHVIPENILDVKIINSKPFVLDSQGQIWIFDNNQPVRFNQKTLVANPVSLTAFSPTKMVVTDTLGNIWLFDGSANPPLALTQKNDLATGAKLIENYQGNLYLINQTSKITYRASNFTQDLASVALYNKAENLPGLATPTDLTISGKIMVADSLGLVLEFSRNALAKTKFQLPFVNGPVKISASEKSPETIIASGQILYFVDSANALNATNFLLTDSIIADLAVDPTNPVKVWLAIDKKLYSLNLPL